MYLIESIKNMYFCHVLANKFYLHTKPITFILLIEFYALLLLKLSICLKKFFLCVKNISFKCYCLTIFLTLPFRNGCILISYRRYNSSGNIIRLFGLKKKETTNICNIMRKSISVLIYVTSHIKFLCLSLYDNIVI